jgi:dolichyl-phosphate-mannose-protein mannosyltransferase
VTAARPAIVAHALAGLIGRHRLFSALLVVAAALRVLVQLSYRPALLFYGDSIAYLVNASHLSPESIRPAGYPAFLRAILVVHDLAVVPAVQHVFGLVTGGLVYTLIRRLGAGPLAGSIAAAPVLFDAYELNLEQHVLSEALFTLLIVVALVALLWRSRPSLAACIATGILLAAAALTRSVGLALIAPALAFAIARGGLVRTLALAAAFALPLVGYATWYSTVPHGSFALTDHDGYFLYGRVADFASCSGMRLSPVDRKVLCDPRPPADRPGPNYYVWHQWSTHHYRRFPHRPPRRNAVLQSFALGVIQRQPLAYAEMVLGDMAHYAAFGRSTGPRDESTAQWQFHVDAHESRRAATRLASEADAWGGSVGGWHIGQRLLAGYQRVAYTPGTLLAVAVLLAVAAAAVGGTGVARGLRAETLTLAAAGVLLPLTAAMTSMFDFRYLLPALALLPAAGVLGATTLAARARALRPAGAGAVAPGPGLTRGP